MLRKLGMSSFAAQFSGWVKAVCVAVLLTVSWLAAPGPALARDCDDPSDCAAAATTARNPLVPIAATGAGAGTAILIDAVRRRPTPDSADEEPPHEVGPEVPCQSESDQLARARGRVKTTMATLQRTRDLLASTEQLYEIHRFKATMTGGIDVAFGIGGLFGKDAGGLVNNMLVAGVKNVIKEGVKQTSTGLVVGDFELEFDKLAEEGYKGPRKTWLLNELQNVLEKDALETVMDPGGQIPSVLGAPKGVGLSGPVGDAARRGAKTWAKELAKEYMRLVGGLMDLVGIAGSAANSAEALREMRETMSKLREKAFELESELDVQAVPALKDALASHRGCLQIWIDRHGDDWMEQWVLYFGRESLDSLRTSGILEHVVGPGMRAP